MDCLAAEEQGNCCHFGLADPQLLTVRSKELDENIKGLEFIP